MPLTTDPGSPNIIIPESPASHCSEKQRKTKTYKRTLEELYPIVKTKDSPTMNDLKDLLSDMLDAGYYPDDRRLKWQNKWQEKPKGFPKNIDLYCPGNYIPGLKEKRKPKKADMLPSYWHLRTKIISMVEEGEKWTESPEGIYELQPEDVEMTDCEKYSRDGISNSNEDCNRKVAFMENPVAPSGQVYKWLHSYENIQQPTEMEQDYSKQPEDYPFVLESDSKVSILPLNLDDPDGFVDLDERVSNGRAATCMQPSADDEMMYNVVLDLNDRYNDGKMMIMKPADGEFYASGQHYHGNSSGQLYPDGSSGQLYPDGSAGQFRPDSSSPGAAEEWMVNYSGPAFVSDKKSDIAAGCQETDRSDDHERTAESWRPLPVTQTEPPPILTASSIIPVTVLQHNNSEDDLFSLFGNEILMESSCRSAPGGSTEVPDILFEAMEEADILRERDKFDFCGQN